MHKNSSADSGLLFLLRYLLDFMALHFWSLLRSLCWCLGVHFIGPICKYSAKVSSITMRIQTRGGGNSRTVGGQRKPGGREAGREASWSGHQVRCLSHSFRVGFVPHDLLFICHLQSEANQTRTSESKVCRNVYVLQQNLKCTQTKS